MWRGAVAFEGLTLKILFITPYTPSPIRVRPFNLIRTLSKRGHEITLGTLWSSDKDLGELDRLRADGIEIIAARLVPARSLWNSLASVPRPIPIQAAYCWQPELQRKLESKLGTCRCDVVHVEHLRGARYGTHLARKLQIAAKAQMPIVWDSVDCISHLFQQSSRLGTSATRRLVMGFELKRTRWYEAWLAQQFDKVVVTSEVDRRAFCELLDEFEMPGHGWESGLERIAVVPNGVDLDYFRPAHAGSTPQTIVMTGKMSYHANVAAAFYLLTGIMPRVWEKFPAVRVQIVGQNAPRELQGLARKDPEHIQVTGEVKDIRPFLAGASVAVAPIVYGAGIQNKVLEAMAMGRPVVTTSKALGALDARVEEEVLVGDTPEEFSQQVMRVLRNPGLGERLGRNGRQYVEAKHDWGRVAESLEGIYQLVVGNQQRVH